jgi:hypothetical protein
VRQGLIIMILLGLFLIHLAAAVAAFVFIEWLGRWFSDATMTDAALMSAAAFGAVATILILIAHGRQGLIIAAAIITFWALVMFGASGPTAVTIIVLAVAALAVASAVVLAESFIARRRAARKPP